MRLVKRSVSKYLNSHHVQPFGDLGTGPNFRPRRHLWNDMKWQCLVLQFLYFALFYPLKTVGTEFWLRPTLPKSSTNMRGYIKHILQWMGRFCFALATEWSVLQILQNLIGIWSALILHSTSHQVHNLFIWVMPQTCVGWWLQSQYIVLLACPKVILLVQ